MASSWAVKVYGDPAPQGSTRCIGSNGRHQLIADTKRTKPWRALVKRAGEALDLPGPLSGPVAVEVTFTVLLPSSVKPTSRFWPWKRSSGIGGDIDKLARALLDGLQDAGVFADDAQVCDLHAVKAYPHSPAPDVLDQPGALIRIWLMRGTDDES